MATLYEMLQNDEIDEQTFADTLEALGANEKVEGYCQITKQLQCDTEAYKNEIDRLTARRKTSENAIDRMNNALLGFLKFSGQDKFKAGTFSVSTSTTQAVNIIDENALPSMFLIPQPPKVDKMGIKKALKEGATIPGAELTENEGVRIR